MRYFLLRLPLTQIDAEGFSYIFLCKNMEKAKSHLEEKYARKRHLFYEKDEFLLEDAKELIKEAYIAEAQPKYLIVLAKGYRVEAQNALLKLLEEPPRNIVFILQAPAKTAFLPTIRSRLLAQELEVEFVRASSELHLKTLDIAQMYAFFQKHQGLDKNGLKEMVQAIVCEAIDTYHLHFSEKELDYFQKLTHLCELNARPQNVLIALLLAILQRKHR